MPEKHDAPQSSSEDQIIFVIDPHVTESPRGTERPANRAVKGLEH